MEMQSNNWSGNWLYKTERTKWNYLNIMFNKYNIPLEIIDIIKKYVLVNHSNFYVKDFGERYKHYVKQLEQKNLEILKINYKLAKDLEIEKNAIHNCLYTNTKEIDYLVDISNSIYGYNNLEKRSMITDEDEEYYNDETLGAFCPCCEEEIEVPAYDEENNRWNRIEDLVYRMECREKDCWKCYNEETDEEWRCENCWSKYFFKDSEINDPHCGRWDVCLNCSKCFRNANGFIESEEESEEESEDESE